MVFALLIAAIIWNLGTWYLGLPASSSHTLIGSIIGVGLANQLMARARRHQRRRLGAGDEGRLLAAALAAGRLRAARRCCCWSLQAAGPQRRSSTQEPEGHDAAAAVDPRAPDPDLHRRQLRARLERRPEGHGPHHADPDRHRADRLRAEPRDAGRAQIAASLRSSARCRAGARSRHGGGRAGRRSARGRRARIVRTPDARRRTSCRRCARWSGDIGDAGARSYELARPRARRGGPRTCATTCTSPPRRIRLLDEGSARRGCRRRRRATCSTIYQAASSTPRPSSSRPG